MPFAVNLKHLGAINSTTIASVLIFPTFTSVRNCLLSKTNIYVLISWRNFHLTNWKLLLFSEDGKNDRYTFLKQYFSVKQKNFFCFKMSHQREEMIQVPHPSAFYNRCKWCNLVEASEPALASNLVV